MKHRFLRFEKALAASMALLGLMLLAITGCSSSGESVKEDPVPTYVAGDAWRQLPLEARTREYALYQSFKADQRMAQCLPIAKEHLYLRLEADKLPSGSPSMVMVPKAFVLPPRDCQVIEMQLPHGREMHARMCREDGGLSFYRIQRGFWRDKKTLMLRLVCHPMWQTGLAYRQLSVPPWFTGLNISVRVMAHQKD